MKTTWPLGERKIRVGQATDLAWLAPGPVRAADVPTCAIHFAAGTISPVVGGSALETTVDAIDGALQTLTIETGSPAWEPSLTGETGSAWLITPAAGVFSVRVVDCRQVGMLDTVTLAEPLPRDVDLSLGAILVSALWLIPVPAQIAPERDVLVEVSYDEALDVTGSTAPTRTDTSTLHVVRAPFDAGATTEQLRRHMASLGMVDSGAQGYEAALEVGESAVIQRIRSALVGAGLTEDDVKSPARMRVPLLYYAASHLHMVVDVARAQALREEGDRWVDLVLRAMPTDTNGDGLPDEERQITGPRSNYGAQPGVPSKTAVRFPVPSWRFN